MDSEALAKCIQTDGDAVIIDIDVSPGSRESGVVGVDEWRGRLKVKVSAQPEKGAANKELVSLMAKSLGTDRSNVSISSGQTSTHKSLRVHNVGRDAMLAKLQGVLDAPS